MATIRKRENRQTLGWSLQFCDDWKKTKTRKVVLWLILSDEQQRPSACSCPLIPGANAEGRCETPLSLFLCTPGWAQSAEQLGHSKWYRLVMPGINYAWLEPSERLLADTIIAKTGRALEKGNAEHHPLLVITIGVFYCKYNDLLCTVANPYLACLVYSSLGGGVLVCLTWFWATSRRPVPFTLDLSGDLMICAVKMRLFVSILALFKVVFSLVVWTIARGSTIPHLGPDLSSPSCQVIDRVVCASHIRVFGWEKRTCIGLVPLAAGLSTKLVFPRISTK
ncbi:uncharacterized protein B0T23DRAFT_410962 [Neurospora hispaniola]|uniref:Uncharacterized protein n=1 Tax=Neurospora hispaniola TaxID=588809 RepID=A0AAJ0IDF6_9PEZI|nr:hypothetical protein B0T23DRAFT_410962 [Neurospora hispaniola]